MSLAPQNVGITDAIRNLQNMSLTEPVENPDELMEKFVNGDKSVGVTIVNAISSESFATNLVKADNFSRLLSKGVVSDGKTLGQILLKLSVNESKEVSTKLIANVSDDFSKHMVSLFRVWTGRCRGTYKCRSQKMGSR